MNTKKNAPRAIRTKVFTPSALRKKLGNSKKKIVFTNGCFDLLHRGHVTYLERARMLGDFLIVALNTDSSVKKLKGSDRPINPLEDRMAVLASLECVDAVTWFDESTPLKLITLLRPKILVKGGDWKPNQIVGSKEVKDWGGVAKSLPYLKGRSTTQIIERSRSTASQCSIEE